MFAARAAVQHQTKIKMDEPQYARFKNKWPGLRKCNVQGAVFHGLSFVLLFSLTVADAAIGISPTIPSSIRLLNGLPSANNYTSVVIGVPIYPRAMCIIFTFLSFMAHVSISAFRTPVSLPATFVCGNTKKPKWGITLGWLAYAHNVRMRKNPLRWTEYGLSATVCFLLIQSLTGLTDFAQLSLAAAANVAMIAFGHLAERLRIAEEKDETYGTWELMQRGWFQAFLFGAVVGFVPWINIFVYFYGALSVRPTPAPWPVYTIVWGMFFNFSSFAFVMLVQHLDPKSYRALMKRLSCKRGEYPPKDTYTPAFGFFLVKNNPTTDDVDFEDWNCVCGRCGARSKTHADEDENENPEDASLTKEEKEEKPKCAGCGCFGRIVVRDFQELGEYLYVMQSFTSKAWLSWFSFFAPV